MSYLSDFTYVIVLVHTESLNRHSFITTIEHPVASEGFGDVWEGIYDDETFWYDVGGG